MQRALAAGESEQTEVEEVPVVSKTRVTAEDLGRYGKSNLRFLDFCRYRPLRGH